MLLQQGCSRSAQEERFASTFHLTHLYASSGLGARRGTAKRFDAMDKGNDDDDDEETS
jgi:hypothetical protein